MLIYSIGEACNGFEIRFDQENVYVVNKRGLKTTDKILECLFGDCSPCFQGPLIPPDPNVCVSLRPLTGTDERIGDFLGQGHEFFLDNESLCSHETLNKVSQGFQGNVKAVSIASKN